MTSQISINGHFLGRAFIPAGGKQEKLALDNRAILRNDILSLVLSFPSFQAQRESTTKVHGTRREAQQGPTTLGIPSTLYLTSSVLTAVTSSQYFMSIFDVTAQVMTIEQYMNDL